jgi:hypothetical protein
VLDGINAFYDDTIEKGEEDEYKDDSKQCRY